ncbi:hypothetical protein D1816_12510 [Aquimarina sp. AD10]|uniref:Uncharacterized protein n=1 Tax=Aquimarina aggregata TaxID=1642818 RepID=A0A162YMA1_9FLAO|nr:MULTISPECIES: hypothetical protein [Aquimarina]AXT61133.1 hypothetical protein D1816_12510 [Aquimarina sp. AD10]KZS39225.1 hypothetical protein AWE51_11780 [Aquimarina aggregata]RKN02251.1 hypothetical protein D7033_02100 [Aquimarina sp. AD10]
MKKRCFLLTAFTLLLTSYTSTAQDFNEDSDKWTKGWTNFSPNKTDYPEAEEKLPNIIANHTYLRNDIVYLMSGDVYVTNGVTLTIQEGTIIRCDHENPANLIVTKGSKLIALGSKAYPIVFTSNKSPKSRNSGDWGGILIAGSGKLNTTSGNGVIEGNFNPQFSVYGGNQQDEETTIFSHVRIEFAGNTSKRRKGSNGLSLYGIGSSSIIDNVMVSYSGQDSFNFRGGKNNVQNLISLKAQEDDYQLSEGFKGNLDNIMAIRHPYITSPEGSYAIEVDGYNKNLGYNRPNQVTDITITNATLVNLSDKTNYQHTSAAISASNAALTYIHNSKISGFSDVVQFDKSYTSLPLIQKSFMMDNSFFNIHAEGVSVTNQLLKKESLDILKYNRFTKDFVNVKDLFADPQNNVVPKFNLKQSMNTYMVMQ